MSHPYSGIAVWHFKAEAELHSFDDCEQFVAGRKGGIKLAASMSVRFAMVQGQRAFVIRLYETDVLCYFENGTFWADNGGFNTPTTSYRVNRFGPKGWSFSHSDGLLYGYCHADCRTLVMTPEHCYAA